MGDEEEEKEGNQKKTTNKVSFAPTEKAMKLTDMSSKTDTLGSYTGQGKDKKERPVQDADDL